MNRFSASSSGASGDGAGGWRWCHPRWGRLAAGWSSVFAAVHVYWALGGQAGLASSAGEALAASRPTWFVVVGLWGTAALLVLAGGIGLAAAGTTTKDSSRRWAAISAGVIAAVLVLRSVGVETLLLTGTGGVAQAIDQGEREASLWAWNPWFLLGGALFGLAALCRPSRPPSVNVAAKG